MTGDWRELGRIAAAAEDDGLAGRVAVAIEATVGDAGPVRWSRRGDEVFVSASTIKVAILVAVARAIDRGALRHDDRLSARPVDTIAGSGVLKGMEPGLSLTVDDHAYLMIAISDNTASNVLIEAVGREAVQVAIDDLGATRTRLRRPFLGHLPSDDLPRNEASAADLVTILTAIVDGRAASDAGCAWMRGLLGQQQHLDRLGRDLPDGVTFAGKSGSLSDTVHDTAILAGPGGRVVVAVLTGEVADRWAIDAVLGRLARRAVELSGIAVRT